MGTDPKAEINADPLAKTLSRASGEPRASVPTFEPHALPIRDRETYHFFGEFARGGVGRIVRAFNRELGREVAIKEILEPGAGAEVRFLREAQITARLTHPSIVPIYNAGRWSDGRPFYEMKLVNGSSLAGHIKICHDLPARLGLLTHAIAVAEAIAYAHSKGIIHRDLKPSNVIVGEFGETLVIDWGLAKQLGQDDDDPLEVTPMPPNAGLTVPGALMGTPAYMSPEQARREPADRRSDVYALGALLYHTLTGNAPHAEASSTAEVVKRLAAGEVPSVSEQEPDLRPELAAIVSKAMAPDPDDRYPSAEDLATDLFRYQTGQLVRAHAYSRWERFVRWFGQARRQFEFAAIAAVVAGLALFIATRGAVLGPSCEVPEERLAAVWSPPIAQRIQGAFAASTNPHGASIGQRVTAEITARIRQWQAARQSVCEATADGAQSETMLDARLHCLDLQLTTLNTYTTAWRRSPTEVQVERAPARTDRLLDPERCTAAAVSQRPTKPKTDSGNRVERMIAEANALLDLHENERAQPLADRALEDARAIDDDALIAEALFTQADLLKDANRFHDSVELLLQAADHAGASKHRELLAVIVSHLVYITGDRIGRIDEATRLGRLGEALVQLNDEDPALRDRLNLNLGIALQHAGRYEESARRLRLVLKERRKRTEEAPDRVYDVLNSLGNTLVLAGDYEEAEGLFREGLEIARRDGKDTSQRIRIAYNNLSEALARRGQYEKAIENWKRIIQEELEETGENAFDLFFPYYNLAYVFEELERFDESRAYADAGIDLLKRLELEEHPAAAAANVVKARLHTHRGRFADALSLLERAEKIHRKAADRPSPGLIDVLEARGEALRLQKRFEDARATLDTALEMQTELREPLVRRARARFSLAQTLYELERGLEALAVATKLEEHLTPPPAEHRRTAKNLQAWLSQIRERPIPR